MLTKTQREWAEAQVGAERAAPLTGTVVSATSTGAKDTFVLTVTGEEGEAKHTVQMRDSQVGALRGKGMTVRVDGRVSAVRYDEEAGRVGLVIANKNAETVEWHVPPMSDAEKADIETARQAERDQAEALARDTEARSFRERVLSLIRSDEDVRAALRTAVADE